MVPWQSWRDCCPSREKVSSPRRDRGPESFLTQQFFRVERSIGRLFVLEVDENVAVRRQVLLEFVGVLFTFLLRVLAFAQAVVAEISGDNIGALDLFAFG